MKFEFNIFNILLSTWFKQGWLYSSVWQLWMTTLKHDLKDLYLVVNLDNVKKGILQKMHLEKTGTGKVLDALCLEINIVQHLKQWSGSFLSCTINHSCLHLCVPRCAIKANKSCELIQNPANQRSVSAFLTQNWF